MALPISDGARVAAATVRSGDGGVLARQGAGQASGAGGKDHSRHSTLFELWV